MNDKNINIVCTIDNNYVMHCTVMLQSLFFNNKNIQFKVFIIHNGLTAENRKIISNFLKKKKHLCEFILIDETQIRNAPINGHISLATYYRILIPEVLDLKIKKALFLDSDMIVLENIEELWEENVDNYPIAATLEHVSAEYKTNLGMAHTSAYFNAGVLLMNLEKWRNENRSRRIIEYIKQNYIKLLTWDQDALNIAFENNWKQLPPKWNVGHNFFKKESLHEYFDLSEFEYNQVKKKPSIIHFSGSLKPWLYRSDHPYASEYIKYKKMTPWKRAKLIGEPTLYNKYKFFLKKIVKKYVWNSRYLSF